MEALAHYDNNEFEDALGVFDRIADTSKILFNCGVINATLGLHQQAVCYETPSGQGLADWHRWNITSEQSDSTSILRWHISKKVFPTS